MILLAEGGLAELVRVISSRAFAPCAAETGDQNQWEKTVPMERMKALWPPHSLGVSLQE